MDRACNTRCTGSVAPDPASNQPLWQANLPAERRSSMPAKTEKQRKFMGAELERKREGKKTKTGMSEKELEKMAGKPKKS
jgi:hypothetical protein